MNMPYIKRPTDWEIKQANESMRFTRAIFGWALVMAVIALVLFVFFFVAPKANAQNIPCPANLYQGIIAEDCSGDYDDYLVIASVVRNRLAKGMNIGLVAMKRKNLEQFVNKECSYALKVRGKDLIALATKSIAEVFNNNKDYAFGAIYYEHTGIYPIPSWMKKMQIVKVLHKGTKREITLAKAKGE